MTTSELVYGMENHDYSNGDRFENMDCGIAIIMHDILMWEDTEEWVNIQLGDNANWELIEC